MKTLQFKLLVLLFILSIPLSAQTEKIYSKSFETDTNTTVLLKLSGSSVEIESSLDDKFHIEYSINFENYPNRKKKGVIEKVQIEAQIIDNHITVTDKSKFYNNYRFNLIFLGILYKNDTLKEKMYTQKPKDLLLTEIEDGSIEKPFYIEYLNKKYKNDEEKKQKLINRYNKKKRRKSVRNIIIKVPNNLYLTIDAKNTVIRLNNDMKNKLSIRLDGGKLISKSMHNQDNVIKVKDALFMVKSIRGGNYTLNNIRKGLIGSMNEVKLSAEFSNIEIGENQKNNEIIGFNNLLVIHNFSNDFSQFKLSSEYSKLHLFFPENNFSLSAFGNNSILYDKGVKVNMQPNTDGKKYNMMSIKPKDDLNSAGAIHLDVKHEVIYIYKK